MKHILIFSALLLSTMTAFGDEFYFSSNYMTPSDIERKTEISSGGFINAPVPYENLKNQSFCLKNLEATLIQRSSEQPSQKYSITVQGFQSGGIDQLTQISAIHVGVRNTHSNKRSLVVINDFSIGSCDLTYLNEAIDSSAQLQTNNKELSPYFLRDHKPNSGHLNLQMTTYLSSQ